MKLVRRIVCAFALGIILTCAILLRDDTAPNPTGRRQSSAPVLMSSVGTSNELGAAGEGILSTDLRGVPSNNDAGQQQCICDIQLNQPPVGCRVCIARIDLSASSVTFRRPDFVTPTYIIEVKNRKELLGTQADQLQQIRDYATAAQTLKIPLWLFVRVGIKTLDPQYVSLVQATGGDVIRYLAEDGTPDPITVQSRIGVGLASPLLVGIGLIEISAVQRRRKKRNLTELKIRIPVHPDDPLPSAPRTPNEVTKNPTTLAKAKGSIAHAEQFSQASSSRLQDNIDQT